MMNNQLVADALPVENLKTEEKSKGIGLEPGHQLQRVREEHNWSRAKIAASLCLNVNVITALEENDYSHLPYPTFVRGYIRNYANLLELAPEPLLAAYERRNVNVPPPVISLRPHQSSDYIWHFFSYLVLLGLLVLVVMWWRSDIPPDLMVEQRIAPAATAKFNHAPVSQETSSPEMPSRELAEILAAGPPAEEPSLPTRTEPVTPATTPSASTTEQPVTDATSTPAHATTVTTPNKDLPAATTPPTPEQPTVTVRVTADTWVKIYDGKGKKLFNSMLKAEKTHTAKGKLPFKIRLGRVDGVTVDYNGQLFDFSSYIKGQTANFLVGKP